MSEMRRCPGPGNRSRLVGRTRDYSRQDRACLFIGAGEVWEFNPVSRAVGDQDSPAAEFAHGVAQVLHVDSAWSLVGVDFPSDGLDFATHLAHCRNPGKEVAPFQLFFRDGAALGIEVGKGTQHADVAVVGIAEADPKVWLTQRERPRDLDMKPCTVGVVGIPNRSPHGIASRTEQGDRSRVKIANRPFVTIGSAAVRFHGGQYTGPAQGYGCAGANVPACKPYWTASASTDGVRW
jgi:hypothetical protein